MLVVDDHDLVRAGIELLVRQRFPGAEVLSCAGLDEAFAELEHDPSVVLLDLNLEGLSREAAVLLVRHRWPHAQVIVVTAETDQVVLDTIRGEGVAQCVRKSEPPERLLAVLEELAGLAAAPEEQPCAVRPLSRRQVEVLQHLRRGHSNKVIARIMGLSEFTVRGHVQQIIKATGATNRTHAVFLAEQAGLL